MIQSQAPSRRAREFSRTLLNAIDESKGTDPKLRDHDVRMALRLADREFSGGTARVLAVVSAVIAMLIGLGVSMELGAEATPQFFAIAGIVAVPALIVVVRVLRRS